MSESPPSKFQQRVTQAAEAVLEQNGSIGPLELFQQMCFLAPSHVEAWRKGNAYFPSLQRWIQVGPEKFQKTIQHFQEWVKQRGLSPIQANYSRRTPAGIEPLRVTENGDPEGEIFFRTHYAPGNLPEKKTVRLAEKLNRPPDLVVFQKVSEEGNCADCGLELGKGDLLLMEKGKPLCLACADMDHLLFLPAGDTALTRRARKYSALSAVVVRFNRSRRRYERQGVLVAEGALARAEEECVADAPQRAAARARAAVARAGEDREFIRDLTQAILERYPACPPEEAKRIAAHTGLRSSGRVGRSAAGQALAPRAVELAVIAHIRHEHTGYDELLMQGIERLEARAQIHDQIERVLSKWSGS